MLCKGVRKLGVVARIIMVVVTLIVAAIVYFLRDKRFLIGAMCNDDAMVMVEVDGVREPTVLFVDSSPTVFYDAAGGESKSDKRRLLLVLSGEHNEVPIAFSLSKSGVGVVWSPIQMLSVLNNKILLCYPTLNVAYDVRYDMKGLDARVEKKHCASHVEYCILGRYHERKRKINVKISIALYSLIVGDAECKPVESQLRTNKLVENVQSVPQILPLSAKSASYEFSERQTNFSVDVAQYASDMNDVMDEMLNRSEIPADYAETMVAVFRDKSLGDVVRDFAVQHIGLYAETLNMRGKYDADSSEAATLRDALWDAAEETHTIIAAAAFRALADMSAFDPHIDASRLDNRLASCVTDASASPAARVMAAQLCGERRVVSARAALVAIAADRAQPEPLRLAAANSAKLLAE